MAVGTACDVLSAFLVTFFTPYIQNGPQIALGARTAFIWMGCSIVAFFFCLFAVPELKVGPLVSILVLVPNPLAVVRSTRGSQG